MLPGSKLGLRAGPCAGSCGVPTGNRRKAAPPSPSCSGAKAPVVIVQGQRRSGKLIVDPIEGEQLVSSPGKANTLAATAAETHCRYRW